MRLHSRLPALLAALLVLTGAAPADPPDSPPVQIVKKMIAAYGGVERWNATRDGTFLMRVIAYGVTYGKPRVSETRVYFTKDPETMVRLDLKRSGKIHSRLYRAGHAWSDIDGDPTPTIPSLESRIGYEARSALLWVEFPFNLMAPGVRVEFLGEAELMGVRTYVLQVAWPEGMAISPGDVHRFYVNAGTYLLLRQEYFSEGKPDQRMETFHGDYRSANGLLKDHLREIVSRENGRTDTRIEIEDLRFGLDLPPEFFLQAAAEPESESGGE